MTVEALRRRRPETLGQLLEAYGRELQAVAYLILRDRAEAEDAVIETLLTAFERGHTIRDERALRAGSSAWSRTTRWAGGGGPRGWSAWT
jgi:DNA-directed RNA polymerase specialized sigma24 family protein